MTGRTDGWRYLNALGQACNEIGQWIYNNPPATGYTPAYTILREYAGKPPNGWDAYDYAVQVDHAINTFLGTSGTFRNGWAEYTDNSGEWEGKTTIPRWSTVQDVIDYLIAKGEMVAGTTVITLKRGILVREWAWQRYKILNELRWFSGFGEPFSVGETMYFTGTGYTKYGYSGVSWAAAQSAFNSASYSSGALSNAPDIHHYADLDTSPAWNIERRYASMNVSSIGTNIAHQLVWYRKAETTYNPFGTYTTRDYEDNDGSATEDTFHKVHQSTVATTATRTAIQLGSNAAASTVSVPTTPGALEDNARGYAYGNGFNQSDPVVIWKLSKVFMT